ncbi:MAG TPA: hypothetical protein VK152_13760, partial [Paludibacter sp.]|nr:hypothetical protein [Paludibacter sp.]
SKNDLRKVLVALTEKGEAMQHEACEIPLRLMGKLKEQAGEGGIANAFELKKQLASLIESLEALENEKQKQSS